MMPIGWSSGKKKVDIGRLIDWLVGIPSLRGSKAEGAISLKIPSLRGVSETNDEAISLKT